LPDPDRLLIVTKVIPERWAASQDEGSGSKRVRINVKPCKQYNEKIVTPHLI
jgi:hypothetical protein